MARLVSLRSTCARRTVGCVLVDAGHRVLATGYNGGLPGERHCLDAPCAGLSDEPGDVRRCLAIHAEENALLQCGDRATVVEAYCTDSPCLSCARRLCLLMNLKRVHFARPYAEDSGRFFASRKVQLISHVGIYEEGALSFASLERGR